MLLPIKYIGAHTLLLPLFSFFTSQYLNQIPLVVNHLYQPVGWQHLQLLIRQIKMNYTPNTFILLQFSIFFRPIKILHQHLFQIFDIFFYSLFPTGAAWAGLSGSWGLGTVWCRLGLTGEAVAGAHEVVQLLRSDWLQSFLQSAAWRENSSVIIWGIGYYISVHNLIYSN